MSALLAACVLGASASAAWVGYHLGRLVELKKTLKEIEEFESRLDGIAEDSERYHMTNEKLREALVASDRNKKVCSVSRIVTREEVEAGVEDAVAAAFASMERELSHGVMQMAVKENLDAGNGSRQLRTYLVVDDVRGRGLAWRELARQGDGGGDAKTTEH